VNENCSQYLLGLTLIPGLGNIRIRRMVDYFGDFKSAWLAEYDSLLLVPGIGEEIAKQIVRERKKIYLEREWEKLLKHNTRIVSIYSDQYPENLKHIYNPPVILYYKGSLSNQDNYSLAVVGSRKASYSGMKAAEQITKGLVEYGFSIISGLARGIDTVAHKAALDNGGRTVAVLGSGLNIIYPRENKKIASRIEETGLILSEYPLDTPPNAENFPRRNRIISGLSMGVLVVEAAEKSGALITADFALEQGRDVFALPGNINNPLSKGTNNLLKQGAKLVTEVNDILEEYGQVVNNNHVSRNRQDKSNLELEESEKILLSCIDYEPISLEEIIQQSDLELDKVISGLLYLELKGFVCQLPGKYFIKRT